MRDSSEAYPCVNRTAISPGEISEVEPVLGITKKALAQILEGEGAGSITKLVLSPFAIPSSGTIPFSRV